MLIGYKDDENDAHTSTHTSSIDIQPSSENVTRLVLSIGKEEMSVKSMMGIKSHSLKRHKLHVFLNICSLAHEDMSIGGGHLCSMALEHIFIFSPFSFDVVINLYPFIPITFLPFFLTVPFSL